MVNHERLSPLSPQDAVYRQCGIQRIDPPSTFKKDFPGEFTTASYKTYQFTTENIGGYIGDVNLPIRGSRIAVVSGSGDFPINTYLYGATMIDAVDISPVACLWGELKFAGLKTFNYDEFLSFFGTIGNLVLGPESFSFEQYHRLRGLLSETARHFFDQLITKEGRHQFLQPNAMFITKIWDMHALRRMNPYLQNEQLYEEARKAAKPTLFYPQDIRTFLKQRKERYDVIYLSNVEDYLRGGKDPITVAKQALVVGGVVMTTAPGYPSMGGETQEHVDSRQRESEKRYKMKGFWILANRGYEADDNYRGAIAVFVLKKQPSLLDRLRRRSSPATTDTSIIDIYVPDSDNPPQ